MAHRVTLASISSLVDAIPAPYKVVATAITALVTVVSIVATLTGSVKAGLAVPGKLDEHIKQQDTVIWELRESNKIARQTQCLMISPKPQWPACLADRNAR